MQGNRKYEICPEKYTCKSESSLSKVAEDNAKSPLPNT